MDLLNMTIGHKSMNFNIRRLNRGNVYLLSHSFQIWGLINGKYVMIRYKISAQYL